LSPFHFCCLWSFYLPPHVGAPSIGHHKLPLIPLVRILKEGGSLERYNTNYWLK